ncbi:MAG: hypothetical protein QXF52_05985 [Thermoproteota archaeon]
MTLSEKDEEIIESLKKELKTVREKRERAIGPEVYNYYWEKEKKLEELISMLIKHRQIAEEAVKAKRPVPRVNIEEIRRRLFEDAKKDKKQAKGEAAKSVLKEK